MANDFSNIISKLNGSAWFITPEALQVMLDILDMRMSGSRLTDEEIRLRIQADDHDRQYESATVVRGVGVVPLYGPVFPKANLLTAMSGAQSLETFRNDFRKMMTNDFVSTILLDIDSPGGYADMIPEMAREIRSARERKDIIAVANTSMNSAAYYLGSQASRVYVTDSGQIGSVGVLSVHTDDSRRDEMDGLKHTFIHAGKYKAEMAGPLSEETKAHVQAHVDALYGDFIADVAAGRNTTSEYVDEHYGQGRVLLPRQAVEVGMADGIRTFDSILGRLIESGGDIRALDSATGHVVPMTASSGTNGTLQLASPSKEHSEPGTGQGGEPVPREAPEKGDKAIEGGWRRDPPPVAYEPQEEEMDREWLEARATALGVEFSSDTSDEDLQASIAVRIDEVVGPMAQATAQVENKLEFARKYPSEAKLLEELQARDRASEALRFAESYQTFADEPKKGFSNVVREKIETAHLKVAERTFGSDDLKELLDSVSSNTAIITYGEEGSARARESLAASPGKTMQETRKAVADLIASAMQDDGLPYDKAMEHVATQNPDLWNAYVQMQ